MKKVLAIGILSVAMFSCKTATNTKNDVPTQIKLKGEWTLTNVKYPSGFKVTSFKIADAKCFEGSQWKFVSNNNTGTVTLNNNSSSCPEYNSKIVWNIKQDSSFNLKFVGDDKAKHVTTGYNLTAANITDTTFELIDNSTEATIVYSFLKNNK
ncbi:lipocalin family protein [Flavobacterium sp. CBA20B-1]|uniref:lipocalin family protein n=1 Tax=unclassified Flavobacterium TaxID=196869 RepID=UPI0022256370|nr:MULTISPECIES: lipocalin family protein [unclassified Flavobacterium]WCM41878.1 lipocalin family protein [Flavobacterium sp. CBA20B-1]